MTNSKIGNEKVTQGLPAIARDDTREATELISALDALEVSEADGPTREETHRLRGDVIEATMALDRKDSRPRR